jgi:hypothetical protein
MFSAEAMKHVKAGPERGRRVSTCLSPLSPLPSPLQLISRLYCQQFQCNQALTPQHPSSPCHLTSHDLSFTTVQYYGVWSLVNTCHISSHTCNRSLANLPHASTPQPQPQPEILFPQQSAQTLISRPNRFPSLPILIPKTKGGKRAEGMFRDSLIKNKQGAKLF